MLLDELNLAGQSVLEGLNGLLDHRAALFVPELGQSFKAHPQFRWVCGCGCVCGGVWCSTRQLYDSQERALSAALQCPALTLCLTCVSVRV